jgi:DNA repair photolyase
MHVLDSFDIPRYLPRMTQMPASGRGRAARSNDAGRYSTFARAEFDDGWSGTDEAAKRQIRTTVTSEKVRTILSRNDSPDLRFNVTLNPYRGCEHGCIYCFARPNHAYVGLSPGLDFETRLFAKPDAARVLERELSKPGYDPQRLQVGASTDAYQPIEKELRITRQVLEVLERFHHPVAITTKSALILRDTDILARMARKELVFVIVAITTLDRRLARAMEPRAGSPPRRIAIIEALSAAGVPVAVGLSPMIPGLTDHEMDAILEAAAGAGAQAAFFIPLRLPREIKDLFREWLEAERPASAGKIISLIRQMHGGRDYDPQFGKRMTREGPVAEMMQARFRLACRRLGLDRQEPALRTDLFSPPPKRGDQLSLF